MPGTGGQDGAISTAERVNRPFTTVTFEMRERFPRDNAGAGSACRRHGELITENRSDTKQRCRPGAT